MVYYVLVEPGFGKDASAGRTVAAYADESDVPVGMKKYGEQITEGEYMELFRYLYKASPDLYINNMKGAK